MESGSPAVAPVVVGFDGSAGSRRAVRWAVWEAADRGTVLRVVVAADDPGVPGTGRTATTLGRLRLADARATLEEAVALAEACRPGRTAGGEVRRGQPGGVLVDQSRQAQLVVVGCRGRSALPASESSTSLITASRAECPVVVVRGRVDAPPTDPVVVGVDAIDHTPTAVPYAVELAHRAGAPLVLACGWSRDGDRRPHLREPVTGRTGSVATAPREVRREAAESLERAVAVVRELDPDLTVRTELVEAGADRLLEGLSWGASLVVVGRGGTGPFPGLPLGPVTRSVLEHAGCPVVVLGPGQEPAVAR